MRNVVLALAALATTTSALPCHAELKLVSGSYEKGTIFSTVGREVTTWQIPGGPVLRARPGTELRVLGQPQEVQIAPGKPRPVYTVILRRGGVDVDVPAKAMSAVAVAALERVTVLVRKGKTSVRATAERVALANLDGDALFARDATNFRALAAGIIRTLEKDEMKSAQLLDAPADLSGQLVFVSTGKPVALEQLSWQRLSGARGYHVELLNDAQHLPLLSVETREPELPRALLDLEPGSYRVAVRAIDELGFESAHALESRLHVISASLPRGAYPDAAGSIRLLPGTFVSFPRPADVKLSYDALGREQAPDQVGLYGKEPFTVFLGAPGSASPVPIRIAPRTVRARVELTPNNATWPKDRINIRIALEDPSGPIPQGLELRPKVTLGVDDLPVAFQRVGSELVGSVPAQATPGPWVVRVEVFDQYGYSLGRSFLEIAPSRPDPAHLAHAD